MRRDVIARGPISRKFKFASERDANFDRNTPRIPGGTLRCAARLPTLITLLLYLKISSLYQFKCLLLNRNIFFIVVRQSGRTDLIVRTVKSKNNEHHEEVKIFNLLLVCRKLYVNSSSYLRLIPTYNRIRKNVKIKISVLL